MSVRSLASLVTDRFGSELYAADDCPTRQLAPYEATLEGVRAAWLELRDPTPLVMLAVLLGVDRRRVLVAVTRIAVAAVRLLTTVDRVHTCAPRELAALKRIGARVIPRPRAHVIPRLAGVADYLELGHFGVDYTPRELAAILRELEPDAAAGDDALMGVTGALQLCLCAWTSSDSALVAELLVRALDRVVVGVAEVRGFDVGVGDGEAVRSLREHIDVSELVAAAAGTVA